MKIEIPDDDAATVRAVLLTHAEFQDQATIENEALQGQLKGKPDTEEVIADLEEAHQDISEDRDELKRIAELFGS